MVNLFTKYTHTSIAFSADNHSSAAVAVFIFLFLLLLFGEYNFVYIYRRISQVVAELNWARVHFLDDRKIYFCVRQRRLWMYRRCPTESSGFCTHYTHCSHTFSFLFTPHQKLHIFPHWILISIRYFANFRISIAVILRCTNGYFRYVIWMYTNYFVHKMHLPAVLIARLLFSLFFFYIQKKVVKISNSLLLFNFFTGLICLWV